MPKDFTLKSGRVVTHKLLSNGANQACMLDGGTMSNDEWQEYWKARIVGYC